MDSFFHLDTPHVEPCSRACPPNAKRTIHQSAISDSQHSAKRVHVKHSTHHAPSQGLLPEAEWAVMQLQVCTRSTLINANTSSPVLIRQPPGLNLCWTPVVAFVASHYSRSAVTLDNVLCKVLISQHFTLCHVDITIRFMASVLPAMMQSQLSRCKRLFCWTFFDFLRLWEIGGGECLWNCQRRLQLDRARILGRVVLRGESAGLEQSRNRCFRPKVHVFE